MTHDEMEQRKRRLEEELRAGIALLEAAHRYQVRALDLVWRSTTEENVVLPSVSPVLPELASPVPSPPPPPPTLARPVRRGAWQLLGEVETALDRLPATFDRNDLCRALGHEPDRGSLYRTLQELVQEGTLAVEVKGAGKLPTTYRKTGATAPPPAA